MNSQNNLQRFIDAQTRDYTTALAEIKNGHKRSHWMWYIFPQILGLGHTETSKYYAIRNLEEAQKYFDHQVLGHRLMEITEEILKLKTNNANQVLGSPDDLKLKSSMTLFASIPRSSPVFQQVLDKFYKGLKDEKTIELMNQSKSG
jgi:uncharacterized protein (DUF1810 family)